MVPYYTLPRYHPEYLKNYAQTSSSTGDGEEAAFDDAFKNVQVQS